MLCDRQVATLADVQARHATGSATIPTCIRDDDELPLASGMAHMTETRKLAAILAADVVGFSRLANADEDRTLARLRALRSDLIDPTIAMRRGRVVKRTGDGAIVEFRSVVDAVRCATEIQNAMIERNSGLPDDQRIVFRIGIHVGDVVEEPARSACPRTPIAK